ncbi:hypothetical protein IE53DRAFT_228374 [Violaceomyces palustris]|uniref:Uncharacterized protein n=1 Tax=Violaceomyces palustris TaxID=1673888 RepID=A0ACD0P4H9_9BASI|nr:hypothetical protein IE53DRAFT_228374 [Violaceomyces palustris]
MNAVDSSSPHLRPLILPSNQSFNQAHGSHQHRDHHPLSIGVHPSPFPPSSNSSLTPTRSFFSGGSASASLVSPSVSNFDDSASSISTALTSVHSIHYLEEGKPSPPFPRKEYLGYRDRGGGELLGQAEELEREQEAEAAIATMQQQNQTPRKRGDPVPARMSQASSESGSSLGLFKPITSMPRRNDSQGSSSSAPFRHHHQQQHQPFPEPPSRSKRGSMFGFQNSISHLSLRQAQLMQAEGTVEEDDQDDAGLMEVGEEGSSWVGGGVEDVRADGHARLGWNQSPQQRQQQQISFLNTSSNDSLNVNWKRSNQRRGMMVRRQDLLEMDEEDLLEIISRKSRSRSRETEVRIEGEAAWDDNSCVDDPDWRPGSVYDHEPNQSVRLKRVSKSDLLDSSKADGGGGGGSGGAGGAGGAGGVVHRTGKKVLPSFRTEPLEPTTSERSASHTSDDFEVAALRMQVKQLQMALKLKAKGERSRMDSPEQVPLEVESSSRSQSEKRPLRKPVPSSPPPKAPNTPEGMIVMDQNGQRKPVGQVRNEREPPLVEARNRLEGERYFPSNEEERLGVDENGCGRNAASPSPPGIQVSRGDYSYTDDVVVDRIELERSKALQRKLSSLQRPGALSPTAHHHHLQQQHPPYLPPPGGAYYYPHEPPHMFSHHPHHPHMMRGMPSQYMGQYTPASSSIALSSVNNNWQDESISMLGSERENQRVDELAKKIEALEKMLAMATLANANGSQGHASQPDHLTPPTHHLHQQSGRKEERAPPTEDACHHPNSTGLQVEGLTIQSGSAGPDGPPRPSHSTDSTTAPSTLSVGVQSSFYSSEGNQSPAVSAYQFNATSPLSSGGGGIAELLSPPDSTLLEGGERSKSPTASPQGKRSRFMGMAIGMKSRKNLGVLNGGDPQQQEGGFGVEGGGAGSVAAGGFSKTSQVSWSRKRTEKTEVPKVKLKQGPGRGRVYIAPPKAPKG